MIQAKQPSLAYAELAVMNLLWQNDDPVTTRHLREQFFQIKLNPEPKFYANSLVLAMEFPARPAFRPPAMASEVNSDGVLRKEI